MNKYTEADYRNTHKGIVEDMVDTLINEWHKSDDPLRARVCRNLASKIEDIREAMPDNLNIWVNAANMEDEYTRSKS